MLGTNGAGKSTLLRVICGLESPTSGQVVFDGRPITGVPAERLAAQGLALICGGKAVFTDMTIEENLQMQALGIRRQRALLRERMDRVFTTFPRLAERRAPRGGQLSGGRAEEAGAAGTACRE